MPWLFVRMLENQAEEWALRLGVGARVCVRTCMCMRMCAYIKSKTLSRQLVAGCTRFLIPAFMISESSKIANCIIEVKQGIVFHVCTLNESRN